MHGHVSLYVSLSLQYHKPFFSLYSLGCTCRMPLFVYLSRTNASLHQTGLYCYLSRTNASYVRLALEMHKSAGASMRLIRVFFLYLVVADGFAAFPGFCAPSYASARRIALPGHAYSVVQMVQDTPGKNKEAAMLLARRAVLSGAVVGAASLSGCRSGSAHCLTQACLSDPALLIQDPALGVPLSPSVTADSGEKAGQDEKAEGGRSLPASAYLPLKNGQVVCRLQLGLLQLSPKTSLLLPYKPFTRGEDMNR
jgi:hypothetical protein